jgi:predicted phage terminase large subunit-like protein
VLTDDEVRARIARERVLLRRFAIEGDPRAPGYGDAFMRTYLPHYSTHPVTGVYVPPAQWHADFDAQVYGTLGQGVRKPFLAPRGFAKSTKVSLATPLICLARDLKKYVLLIQETGPQAKQAMSQIIHELDNNERLLSDFPGLKRAYVKGRPVADRDDDIAFASGARLQSLGAGGSLRGRRNQEQRPDLVLIDDLEDDEHVRTDYQRDKIDEWVSSALMGALAPGADVYMVGTLLHHDAVLARLMDRWGGIRYEAMYDQGVFSEFFMACDAAYREMGGGEWNPDLILEHVDPGLAERAAATSTWPGWWPAIRLATAKHDMGSAAFSREILHEPISDEDKTFPRDRFRWRNTKSRLLASDGTEFKRVKLRCIIDPAIGEKVSNDYSAIAVCAQVQPGEYDVLDVWQGRLKQAQLIERCRHFDHVWKLWHPVWIVESVAAQAWLAQELRRVGLSVREVKPTRDKLMRAEPIGVLYENGQVYHDEALKDGDFELQMHQFPLAKHDDMLDAVVYGITDLAHAPRPKATRL